MNKPDSRDSPHLKWLIPALLAIAAISLFLGWVLPFFVVTRFWIFEDAVSAIRGILILFEEGEYFLFVIIGFFTVVFPSSKIALLAVIWWNRRSAAQTIRRLQIWVSHLGKWSMLDVFVVALLLVFIRTATGAAEMTVGIGLYLFSAAILLSQATSGIIDRLLQTDLTW